MGFFAMLTTQISLTEAESEALRAVSLHTGKAQEELIHEALGLLLARYASRDRLALLRRGWGIWRGRTDLPTVEELRDESNRFQA